MSQISFTVINGDSVTELDPTILNYYIEGAMQLYADFADEVAYEVIEYDETRALFLEELSRGTVQAVFAETNGDIVGLATLSKPPEADYYTYDIAHVSKSHRRMGIFRDMNAMIHEVAQNWGLATEIKAFPRDITVKFLADYGYTMPNKVGVIDYDIMRRK